MLNNNNVALILNTAVAMSTGSNEIGTLDLSAIVDNGNDTSVIGSTEAFCKALLNTVIKNWFTDTTYRSQYNDRFYVNSEEFGAIIQAISMEYPNAETSHAWNDFTPDITGRKSVGVYDVYVPVVNTMLFGKTVSWEINISITNEQLKTAFNSTSEMSSFVNYVYMMVDNAIVKHIEEMDELNRNHFIAEKIAYSTSDDAIGTHVINLVQLYHDETNSNITTVEAFLKSNEAMRWCANTISEYSNYMTKMSVNFNTAQRTRFTPKDRQVLLILSKFDKAMKTWGLSMTYNPEYTTLTGYDTISSWQSSNDYSFDTVSSINIKTANNETVDETGIVALLCDKYAIMHTIKARRTAVKYFDPEALTTTFNQQRDQYSNDLTQNAIVFIVKDIE